MITTATPTKNKTRHIYISVVNFVRVKVLEIPELNTPEKRFRDEMEINQAFKHYDKVLKNVESCQNEMQVNTARAMIGKFEERYGKLCKNQLIDLKMKLDLKEEQLYIS